MSRWTEQDIAKAMKDKRLTAPSITPAHVDAQIIDVQYWNPPGTSLTVCVLTLENGFNVVGQSASASLKNFDVELGKTISFEDARKKIWQLEGYLLRSLLHTGAIMDERDGGNRVQDVNDLFAEPDPEPSTAAIGGVYQEPLSTGPNPMPAEGQEEIARDLEERHKH